MKDDLISRKQAQEAVLKCEDVLLNFDRGICAKALKSVPAVDAVEVVRCEDCKWFNKPGCAIDYRNFPEDAPDENDFCSYGERREDNGET